MPPRKSEANPRVTLVICTFRRYDLAAAALKSIAAVGVYDDAFFEVLVVDNTPAADRKKLKAPKGTRQTVCDRVGLSAARNKGLEEARGDYVVYLDDDILMRPSWPAAVKEIVSDREPPPAFGGRVTPLFPEEPPAWFYPKLAEYLSCVDWSPLPRPLKAGEWIVGANMAISTEVLRSFGGFNESLGRSGANGLLSNEEIALFRHIRVERILYHPDMWVDHVIPAERLEQAWFRKRAMWQAVSDILAGETHVSRTAADDQIRDAMIRLPARHRNLNGMMGDAADAEAMQQQMRLAYSTTIRLGL
ncbi:glycosyltransferase [Brevundimonas sp.]|uniref:glycosyltransferase family 2 protein n=1 Tax=Brevundimonas sp. TaxID=1871086 RepID=UPI0025E57ACD|nr:glycosyltransferase [Brevundimonas sp.]